MKVVHIITFILIVVGGINWGLHAFNYNLVDMIFGAGSASAKAVYVLVALSAVFELATHKWNCKQCKGSEQGAMGGAM